MGQKTIIDGKLKARIAIQAISGTPVADLAEKYDISTDDVHRWINRLQSDADQLFVPARNYIQESPMPENDDTLQAYTSLLRATLEATFNGILVIDRNGKIVAYNHRFLDMWNIPPEIMEERDDSEAIRYVMDQLSDPQGFIDRVEYLYEHPEEESFDTLEFKDERVFERYSIPQRIGDKIVGRVWSFVDVTELYKAKKEVQRFGRLLKSINAHVEEGILRSTPEKGMVYVNEAFVKMFGYDSKEEVLDTEPEEFYADAGNRWKLLEKLENEGRLKNEETLFRRKDGTTFWGLESSILVEKDGEQFIDGIVNDITERKKVEEQLRQSEEKYRTIVENIEDGYFETDLAGNFTFFNYSLRKVLGYSEDELMGMNNREYMDESNAETVYRAFNKVYTTGEPEQGCDWEIITKKGEKRFVEASVTLKNDSDGNPVGFRGIVRDITDRKHHERQIQKSLKEKEVLLGEIHHRVKNNLAVISGLLFLQSEKTEDEGAQELLEQSRNRINSMALIHELLYDNESFSSVDPGKYIHQLIDFITGNLQTGKKDIEVNVKTGDIQLDMNSAIPCALIINELLTNAYKYAFEDRDKGAVEIDFYREGSRYYLKVADNGVGLPENMQIGRDEEHGLGLFLVHTLVKQLEGDISISRENGTQFNITFPC